MALYLTCAALLILREIIVFIEKQKLTLISYILPLNHSSTFQVPYHKYGCFQGFPGLKFQKALQAPCVNPGKPMGETSGSLAALGK